MHGPDTTKATSKRELREQSPEHELSPPTFGTDRRGARTICRGQLRMGRVKGTAIILQQENCYGQRGHGVLGR